MHRTDTDFPIENMVAELPKNLVRRIISFLQETEEAESFLGRADVQRQFEADDLVDEINEWI